MYSTCLFCKNSLQSNEAIEHFPVGRRLAFDGAKGRLWVVCRRCERWNLTPLEERWEAIEECERAYRSTRLRMSTDQIGLARLSEGLELVRIGTPLRPEFAAWRYGDQFGKRRRRNIIQMGAAGVALAAVPILGPVLGLSLGTGGVGLVQAASYGSALYRQKRVVTRLSSTDGQLLVVRGGDVRQTVMLTPSSEESWGLRISHRRRRDPGDAWWRYSKDAETTDLRGDDAMRAAAQILPVLNREGASARVVREAVALTVEYEPTASFEATARMAAKKRSWNEFGKGAKLANISRELLLALEMMSHEDSERRALEGELSLLEDAWREAEEIAETSDNLFLPSEVSTQLNEMKKRVE
jgi:hypothetical protein